MKFKTNTQEIKFSLPTFAFPAFGGLCIMCAMKLQTVIQTLEDIAPLHIAEDWDNVGLLINPLRPRNVKKILLTIDLTEAVADEAIAGKVDLIMAYHPILFRPASRLNADNAYDRTVMKLIQKNVAVYSPHTALDAVIGGVNDWLADGVGEGEVSVLQPLGNSDAGQGRLVELKKPVKLKTLTQRIKKHLGLKTLRIASASKDGPVQTVALCAGAGTDAFKGIQADCYLTGEMSHHNVLASTLNGSHVILCEHTNTERGYLPVFGKILRKALGNGVDICVSEIDSDPIKFN
ncbi:Nif3-like dinuclear metal center hexameric protein [Pontiella sulfatireligans]|uniref:GTP cyclohydrolase 1 type 2 homolog n=1 Tax=Pontiella sulfatireligans TaxID=2750658 RepID=A0A6C2UFM1_9BACT|nr:Nif3-like dinuclear metal center hexameric protein [Pontiella sulfatireligans]VGO18908.1 GTP cyclohydrolase 1 type 2 [Pontiella sulfatireligans]